MISSGIDASRIRPLREAPPSPRGQYVLYWMTAQRRARWNLALDHAAAWARELGVPLLVMEGLNARYPWSSRRLHRPILDGMVDNAQAFESSPVSYYPYVEREQGEARGFIQALAARASIVIADDAPIMEWTAILDKVVQSLPVRVEAVDGCGLLPLDAAPKAFSTAYSFRRHMQRSLTRALYSWPEACVPLDLPAATGELVGVELQKRWPRLDTSPKGLARVMLEVEYCRHDVELSWKGGARAGRERLLSFAEQGLDGYAEGRRDLDSGSQSGLSPYLHCGHMSAHEVLHVLAEREGWNPSCIGDERSGKREGFWGASPALEAYLDQLVTWRELCFNTARHLEDYRSFETLPSWARQTLHVHQCDERRWLYSLDQLDHARTHDELWNAAQRQLRSDGFIHNYLRMLWGKKILEWSPTPRAALERMVELNNRYALDGRDPNSYGGIFWTLGRYDRAWGERSIFGKVRYMSSDSARRKLKLGDYLKTYGPTTASTQVELF